MSQFNAGAQNKDFLDTIADYYSGRLQEHGMTAKGVDWNGPESQALRFGTLAKILPASGVFSIHDIGCGYGAMYDYFKQHFDDFTYLGSDISADMITAAEERLSDTVNAQFFGPNHDIPEVDFSIASGIFNVRLGCEAQAWKDYFIATLDSMFANSRKGFAFNCLTSHSDKHRMVDKLYYPNPAEVFDLCMKRYSRHVALLHDYGLYEFTILVRK